MISIVAGAQKVETVSATITFYASESMTIEEAKRIALDRAKIQAIADKFGTTVSQNNSTVVKNQNGESSIDFVSIGGSEIKGEWIETIGVPKYDIEYDNRFLIVKCEVKGRAREITRPVFDILSKPLRNGTDIRNESYNFKDGDDLFLYFTSPIDGFISVYLLDEFNQIVYNILPYKSLNFTSVKIIANKEYIFFSKNHAEKNEKKDVDEYTLTSDLGMEFHTLYILFSPTEIGRLRELKSDDISLPKNVSYVKFQSWLSKTLLRDKNLQLIQFSLVVEN